MTIIVLKILRRERIDSVVLKAKYNYFRRLRSIIRIIELNAY